MDGVPSITLMYTAGLLMCTLINEHTVRVDLLLADRRVDEASIDHINEQSFTQSVCTSVCISRNTSTHTSDFVDSRGGGLHFMRVQPATSTYLYR
jgi:hypothetical protein